MYLVALILFIILLPFIIDLGGYLVHRFFHRKSKGSHITHHNLYPPRDFLSEEYRSPGSDSFKQDLIYAVPAVFVLLISFALFGFCGLVICLLEIFIIVKLTSYVHHHMHLKNTKLNKYDWFKFLRKKHALHHHFDKKVNYGIISLFWDKVFKTYK